MKLSTVRFVDDASRPQIFEQDLVARDGLPAALGEHAQELDLVEREAVIAAARVDDLRGQVHRRLADRERLGDGRHAPARPAARWRACAR